MTDSQAFCLRLGVNNSFLVLVSEHLVSLVSCYAGSQALSVEVSTGLCIVLT